jgi:hypothetical protein
MRRIGLPADCSDARRCDTPRVDSGLEQPTGDQAGAGATADPRADAPAATPVLDPPTFWQKLLCADCFRGREPPTESDPQLGAQPPNPAGVAALLKIAEDTVEDERERGRALDTKTASLAGFTGAILSINGALAGALFHQKLGPVGRPIAELCFIGAVVCLLIAVAFAVIGVLMPQKYRGMGRQQVAEFTRPDLQAQDATWVSRSMLGALALILAQDRPVNDCKARLTKRVAGLLALGFVFVAGQALTLGLRQVGL